MCETIQGAARVRQVDSVVVRVTRNWVGLTCCLSIQGGRVKKRKGSEFRGWESKGRWERSQREGKARKRLERDGNEMRWRRGKGRVLGDEILRVFCAMEDGRAG